MKAPPVHAGPGLVWLAAAGAFALAGCERAPAFTGNDPPAASHTPSGVPVVAAASQIDAGRYLVEIGGCNDCHTPPYAPSNGVEPPESLWLMGSPVGFSGPWGVSYATNLRLSFQNMTADEFVELARAGQGRPPMPWPSLMRMSGPDLRAMHAYIVHLGPAGEAAPAPLSPGVAPRTPHIHFVPQLPKLIGQTIAQPEPPPGSSPWSPP